MLSPRSRRRFALPLVALSPFSASVPSPAAPHPECFPLEPGAGIQRDQAAVLLEACLPVAPADGERLDQPAPLPGRIERLQPRIAALEALQFSTTTSLRGDVRSWLGGVAYGGNQINPGANTYNGRPLRNAVAFNSDVRFTITTSFDGEDLLRVRLRGGNGGFSPFRDSIAPTLRLSGVAPACGSEPPCRNDWLLLDKLFYQRAIGSNLRVTVGSRLNQKDMIAIWPSAFDDNDNLLSLFSRGGAPGAYSDVKGAGAGFYWIQRASSDGGVGWVLSAVSVAGDAQLGDPSAGGWFSRGSAGANTLQIGHQGGNWAAAATYTHNQADAFDRAGMTPLTTQTWPGRGRGLGGHVNSLGLTAFWQPQTSPWLPAITMGWGFNSNVYTDAIDADAVAGGLAQRPPLLARSQSWMVGLNWYDVMLSGSELAFAIGSPVFLTAYRNPDGQAGSADAAVQLELWYRFQATDQLTLTPGLFWLPRPRGQLTAAGSDWDSNPLPLGRDATLSALGAVLKVRFRF